MDPQLVLDFWYGELDECGMPNETKVRSWWKKDPNFDSEIKNRFEGLFNDILADLCEHWLDSSESTVAYIVVLDQFSRNMFRDTPRMYSGDERAVVASLGLIARGEHQTLATAHAISVYMPLMHSEQLLHQEMCVQMFTSLSDEAPKAARKSVRGNLDYAKKHRDIVARFGRFPHRNSILGRESTPEEIAFLKEPGSSF